MGTNTDRRAPRTERKPKWKSGDNFYYVYAGAYVCTGQIVGAADTTATVHYHNFDGKYHGVPLKTLFKTKRTAAKHKTRTT